jgi:hypothetical protein
MTMIILKKIIKKITWKNTAITNSIFKKKIDKDNFEKNHKKITWENTATIHSVLKKKITKLNS